MTPAELRERRKALNLTQEQMAALLPRPLKTLQGWEQGRPIPPDFWRALRDLERELAAGAQPAAAQE